MAIILPTRHLLYFLVITYEVYILMANALISYYAYRASRVLRSGNMLLLSVGIMMFGIYMLSNSLINISILAYLYYEPARRVIYIPPSAYPWLIVSGLIELASLILIALALSIPVSPYVIMAAPMALHITPIFIIHANIVVNDDDAILLPLIYSTRWANGGACWVPAVEAAYGYTKRLRVRKLPNLNMQHP